jgi:hypothetical protein
MPSRADREPLTQKALAAIKLYVSVRVAGRNGSVFKTVEYALRADRMERSRLYDDLSSRGYYWDDGRWRKRLRPACAEAPPPKPTSKPKPVSRPAPPSKPAAKPSIPDDPAELLELIRAGALPVSARKS